ncbi:MAG: hypothetical protein H0U86_14505 [Chloroflexi bacterium]|nr:hypothetical protein [Chloroflexota bacterium]
MNRRWLALIVAVLAAVVLAPIVLLLLQRGHSPGSPAGSAEPAGSPSASAPEGGIAFADAGSLDEAAWYRHGGDPRQFPPRLQIGTMAEGVTFEVELHTDPAGDPEAIIPLRPVLGIGDGVVVVVGDDGRRSTLRAIVAATGQVHDLLVSDDVIVDGALDPDGRIAYYVTADRLSGDLTGAWRMAVGPGRPPEAMEVLVSAAPEIRLAAITRLFTRVLLSTDGTTLGLFRCIEVDCALRAVRTDDGSLVGEVLIPRGGGDPFALTDRLALLRPIVPDGPDRFGEVVDLATGERARIPVEAWPFGAEAVVAGDDGTLLGLQTAGWSIPPEAMGEEPGARPEVTLIGVDGMQVVATFEPPLSALAFIVEDDYSTGVDLPPGWLLIRGSEPGELVMNAYAMSLADGSLVPLPAVGEFFVQG